MRKLIVCNIISLDGYFEGPGGDVMAMPFDQGFSEYNAERLRAADTLLLGRTSYEGFRSYWPAIADDPDAPPLEREISRRNNEIDKVVVSDTLTPDSGAPWQNTHIVRRAEAHKQIAELKRGPGRDIIVFGSHTLWNDLLAHGLVDELHLMIGAGVLGAGTPAFANRPPVSLRLLGTRTWDGSGLVLVKYTVEPDRAG
jgi:dihydrofolate reductase